jgi:hypothetical protein
MNLEGVYVLYRTRLMNPLCPRRDDLAHLRDAMYIGRCTRDTLCENLRSLQFETGQY